jgi:hypothetical protein
MPENANSRNMVFQIRAALSLARKQYSLQE